MWIIHDGVAISDIPSRDLRDVTHASTCTFTTVRAEKGRHIYLAGEEGVKLLQDARDAEKIRRVQRTNSASPATPMPQIHRDFPRMQSFTPQTPGILRNMLSGGMPTAAAMAAQESSLKETPAGHDHGDVRIRDDAVMQTKDANGKTFTLTYNTRLLAAFKASVLPCIDFESLATPQSVPNEDRRRMLERLAMIRRSGMYAHIPDAVAIDCIVVSATGICANAVGEHWDTHVGARDWASFVELLYKSGIVLLNSISAQPRRDEYFEHG